MTSARPDAAKVFRRLHGDGLLVLANAWDGGTARLMESLGAKAVATTSAAVAWSHGFADGDLLPVPLLAATVADMARVLTVPLSVDIEGGYSADPSTVGDTVERIVERGAVGINIEDGSGAPDLLCAKIEGARRAGTRLGVDLFINARTDVYLRGLAPRERRMEETLARGERYREAGADGLFVPGVTEPSEIEAIASAAGLPLNVLARPGLPAVSELEALGVRRLSAGSTIAEAVFATAAARATAFLRAGTSEPLADGALRYADINALMLAAAR
jgi:2-methylisocitrate lyase-like PEP mutase family enzyme